MPAPPQGAALAGLNAAPASKAGAILRRAARVVPESVANGVLASSKLAKDVMMLHARSAGIPHPPRKRWGARFKFLKKNATAQHQAVVFMWGAPPYWTEYGTRRVALGSRGGIGPYRIPKSRGGKRFVRLPDGGVRRYVMHPGRRAKPWFRAARDQILGNSRNVFRVAAAKRFLEGMR